MKIDQTLLEEYMNTFFGYGNLKGKYWFIGMEEGGGNSIEEINSRLEVWKNAGKPVLLDNFQFHSSISGANGFKFDHFFKGEKSRYQPTWGGLIKLLLSYVNEKMPSLEQVKAYQSSQLGRQNSDNCIVELFPLPSPRTGVFHYSKWTNLECLKTRKYYKTYFKDIRVQKLKYLISENKPEFVVFYSFSRDYIEFWSQISGINFINIESKLIGSKERMMKAKFALSEGICYAIIHHPTCKGINDEYLMRVGESLKRIAQHSISTSKTDGIQFN